MHVRVQHQLIARIQPPGEPVRFHVRRAARFPEKKIAVGRERAAEQSQIHSRKAAALTLQRPQAVNQKVGVMHQVALARTDLDGAHVARGRNRGFEYEVPVNIRTGRRRMKRRTRFQHQIRRPQLPALGERRRRGCFARRSLRSTFAHPRRDGPDLLVAEPPLTLKIPVAALRKPRWHVPAARHLDDVARMLFHILVTEQRERRRLSRAVARRAVVINDRSDVVGERQFLRPRRSHPQTPSGAGRRLPD